MKPLVPYPLMLLLVLVSIGYTNAQHRAIYFKLKSIRPDTVRKQLVFQYRLGNIAPRDSLSVELVNGTKEPFRLKAVYGDVGTVLTDGKNKLIYWNPVADRQRIDDSPVAVRFVVKTVPGQGLTRWQVIKLGRWVVGSGLTAYALWEGIDVLGAVRHYNQEEQPTSLAEKSAADAQRIDIQTKQRNFYRVAALSATALLINITWSMIQSRHKLKPGKLAVTGANHSVGLAYNL